MKLAVAYGWVGLADCQPSRRECVIYGMAAIAGRWHLAREDPIETGDSSLDQRRRMESFLRDTERRAFRIARYSTGNPDDALDLVQDAMLKLVKSYADRPTSEWAPLFYRILDNGITDWYRRRATRQSVMSLYQGADESQSQDPVEAAVDSAEPGPERRAGTQEALALLDKAIGRLPERQRQAFLLRMLEGLDTRQTATAMGCSAGSVKTHYFRALKVLRAEIGEAW